ncbi:hypothetical protein Tco_0627852 [Tanacetum coccineum]|uniref:Xylulose kinase-1 n=1 Tax=Tanacetum coccineum TaxID=301880 RepID=A0ABQ4WNP9_9ASTR
MWHGTILQGLGKRNRTEDLNLCALNATTIMMDSVLPSAPTTKGLAISPGTVEANLLLPTTKDPKGHIKESSLALSVELRVILRVIAQNYPIWEVIQNGNGPVSITTDTSGQIKVLPPRTAEEIVARERERKARTTLLMALPEDHLAKFHKMTDAKEMWDAIKF